MPKTKSRLVYVIGSGKYDCGYTNWIGRTGLTDKMEEADLCFGLGGSDVGNIYYNQPNSGHCYHNPETDTAEYFDYKKAIKLGKKIAGTCKALQWASALAGGAIFQDVRHPHYHEVKTFDGQHYYVNSLHHNLADLSKLKENEDYKLLA